MRAILNVNKIFFCKKCNSTNIYFSFFACLDDFNKKSHKLKLYLLSILKQCAYVYEVDSSDFRMKRF